MPRLSIDFVDQAVGVSIEIIKGRHVLNHGRIKAEKAKAEEEVDIDLEDPEVNEAAKKMQACFKARKKTV